MAFLFARNKQKVIAELARDARGLLEKLKTVDQLPAVVSGYVLAT
jgi:hypothetical protein